VNAWAPEQMVPQAWAESLAQRHTFVAEEPDGIVVGFGELETGGHIHRFYVHKDRQGLGIGTRLLTAIEQAARAQGFHSLHTEASITARPFFERHRFRVEREQEVHLGGVAFINYRMNKLL
jgi:putative acetyltransferase